MSTWEPGEIAAFCAARLDEEGAAAQDLARGYPGPWSVDASWVHDARGDIVVHDEYHWSALPHVARYDPARALREVEAKRKRVALMTEAQAEMDRLIADPGADRAGQAMAVGRARAATVAVKYDAAVWSDHADYKGEA